jgi:hypothetical protein
MKKNNEIVDRLLVNITLIIVTILLIMAVGIDFPYGFYNYLRIVITCYCIYEIIQKYKVFKDSINYYIIYILIAILYNPIIKISLDKEVWQVINIITIVLFWGSYIFKGRTNR